MDNQNSLKIVKVEKALSEDEQKDYRLKLAGLAKVAGIISICLESEELYLEYDPYKCSIEFIQAELEKIGFPTKKKKKQNFFQKSINRLAQENKESYSNKKLECCNLNKN